MARSVIEIRDAIIAEKESRSELAKLTSSSAVAVWRVWVYITAVIIHFHETLFDLFKKEVETKIATMQPGTPSWYTIRVKEFQKDDPLVVVDGVATYSTKDATKQIITRASYKEDLVEGVITLKLAKGEIGEESALSSEELFQVKTYMERIKFAGTRLEIVSLNADKLRLTAEIFYSGIYPLADIKERVKTALHEYMRNLDFDGNVYINKIIDAVQNVEGVIDFKINDATAIAGVTPNTFDRIYETASGYIVEETESGFTFEDLLTFTPQYV